MECDEWQELAVGISLSTRRWLLVPVNDNESFDGTSNHWSLLLMFVPTAKCFHFDSHGCYNQKAAEATAEKLYRLLQKPPESVVQLQRAIRSPQQMNGHDCGVYVLLAADWLAQQLSNFLSGIEDAVFNSGMPSSGISDEPALLRDLDSLCAQMAVEAVNPVSAENFRQDMYTLIVRGRVNEGSFMVDRKI